MQPPRGPPVDGTRRNPEPVRRGWQARGAVNGRRLATWYALRDAAQILGLSSDALRRRFERNAQRMPDGVTEATIDGVRARKFGNRWRISFGAGWAYDHLGIGVPFLASAALVLGTLLLSVGMDEFMHHPKPAGVTA